MPPLSDSQRAARIKAVHEHFRIENTHDLDAVMATFGNTCSFLANNELHEGREAVRAFYGEFFRGFPDLRFDIKSVHVGDDENSKLRDAIIPTPRQQGVDGEEAQTGTPSWSWVRLLGACLLWIWPPVPCADAARSGSLPP